MTDEELYDAMEGLFAYDTGSIDSGIHNNELKRLVLERLHAMDDRTTRYTLGRFMRDRYLTEESMDRGYGPEDICAFITWLSEHGYDL